MTPLVVFCSGQ